MLDSGIQQSDSVIHIHVSILFQILFPFTLLQNIDQSSLCCTVGLCWLSILNMLLLLSRFSRVRPCVTPQTTVHQTPLSLGFSRQEDWSGLPFPSLILNIVVYICQSQTPNLSLPPSLCWHRSSLVTSSLFSKSVSLFLFCK